MARYEAGETLASIARTYDCSPPAISYVVSRSRARRPAAPSPLPAVSPAEPQLLKAAAAELAPAVRPREAGQPGMGGASPAAERAPMPSPRPEIRGGDPAAFRHEPLRSSNGTVGGSAGDRALSPGAPRSAAAPPQRPAAAAPQPSAEQRRTLHLSLGAPGHPNGAANYPGEEAAADLAAGSAADGPAYPLRAGYGGGRPFEARPDANDIPPRRPGEETPRLEAVGTFIGRELRARVDGDIAVFLAAFDAALAADTQENRSALREATDRLLRAGARTRIELERLEARAPLTPRDNRSHDNGGRGESFWRR